MKKIVFLLLLLIVISKIIFSEVIVKEKELLKIKIVIGAVTYYRYIQLSSPNFLNNFKIIKREE